MTLEDSVSSSTEDALNKSVSRPARSCSYNAVSYPVRYSIRKDTYDLAIVPVFYSLDMSVADFVMTKIKSYANT
jgi:hypothetical protein